MLAECQGRAVCMETAFTVLQGASGDGPMPMPEHSASRQPSMCAYRRAGTHCSGPCADLLARFPKAQACPDYLDWPRWTTEFVRLYCGSQRGWRNGPGRRLHVRCARRVWATDGTMFPGLRMGHAIGVCEGGHPTGHRQRILALGFKRMLGVSAEQTD